MNASEQSFISRHPGIARIFYIQGGLVIIATVLVLIAVFIEQPFGFFWFGFLAGCLGASISLLKRSPKSPNLLDELSASWTACLIPILYGGVMAGVAYILFVSRILAGVEPSPEVDGLFTSNLFPVFTSSTSGDSVTIQSWIEMRPKGTPDLGKLLVWSFVAGYSETFITRILGELEEKK